MKAWILEALRWRIDKNKQNFNVCARVRTFLSSVEEKGRSRAHHKALNLGQSRSRSRRRKWRPSAGNRTDVFRTEAQVRHTDIKEATENGRLGWKVINSKK